MRLAQGWELIRVNFDPKQEIQPKVCVCVCVWGGGGGGGGRSFEGGALLREYAW